MKQENWKWITGYKDLYEVSDLGNVRRHYKNGKVRMLKLITVNRGYLRVYLSKNRKVVTCRVHRVVAEAFIPNTYRKDFVNHLDGNKKNNEASNLEWCTMRENFDHAMALGLLERVKLDMDLVKRLYIEECMTQEEIASMMNTTGSTIGRKLRKIGITKQKQVEFQKQVYAVFCLSHPGIRGGN